MNPSRGKEALTFALATALGGASATAQNLTGTVLYELAPPNGFTTDQPSAAANGQVVGECESGGTVQPGTGLVFSAADGTDGSLATLWNGTSTFVNLNPTSLGFVDASTLGTDGAQQVGEGDFGPGTNRHALLWSGTAASAVDLNPSSLGISNSEALGNNGTQQVGVGWGNGTGGDWHALSWSGTAASAVDLNPSNLGISNSEAYGVNGAQQVGEGSGSGTGGLPNALLWSGTAASAVNLNPSSLGINQSWANATSGAQQVGAGNGSGTGWMDHALLWNGTADSAVDLNPSSLGFTYSEASYTNGAQQVGSGGERANCALLWSGTAASAVDLQSLLPANGSWTSSGASTIDASGNVFGWAYGTYNGVTDYYAVEWSPVNVPGPVTETWTNASGNSLWDNATSANWNTGSATTTFSGGNAVMFNDSNGGNYAVTLNTTVSPGSMTFNNSTGNYTISGTGKIVDAGAFNMTGSGTVTIGTALSVGSMSITGGTLQLASNTTLGSGSVTSNINLTSLSITGNGVLDVSNNHVIITYGSSDPITTIAGYIKSGYNGGAWNGPGIISSAARTPTNGLLYGLGYADSADAGNPAGLSSGQIEVMYTLLGDANLDGSVNGEDFTILASNFNQPVTSWDQGDFNYDGEVNGEDFTLMAANFNQEASGTTMAGDLAALDAFAAANGLPLPTSSVPEPASAAMMVMAGLGMLRRRRRSSRQASAKPIGAGAMESSRTTI
jgi:hypothetical protein